MPLPYDPRDAFHWVPQAGDYPFRVLECVEHTFKTGAHGVRVRLEVEAGGRVPLRIWDNIVFGPRTTWKMRDLCQATGVPFDPPCEADDLMGKTGRARFSRHEHDDLITLSVDRYLSDEA